MSNADQHCCIINFHSTETLLEKSQLWKKEFSVVNIQFESLEQIHSIHKWRGDKLICCLTELGEFGLDIFTLQVIYMRYSINGEDLVKWIDIGNYVDRVILLLFHFFFYLNKRIDD